MQICKFAGNLSTKRAVPQKRNGPLNSITVCVTSFLKGFHKQP